jgi:hypothetical protein
MAALFGAPYLQTRTVHPDTCSCLPRHSSTTEWRPISRPTYCWLVGLGERNTGQSCVILMFGRRRWDVGPLVGAACLAPVGLGRRFHEEGQRHQAGSTNALPPVHRGSIEGGDQGDPQHVRSARTDLRGTNCTCAEADLHRYGTRAPPACADGPYPANRAAGLRGACFADLAASLPCDSSQMGHIMSYCKLRRMKCTSRSTIVFSRDAARSADVRGLAVASGFTRLIGIANFKGVTKARRMLRPGQV